MAVSFKVPKSPKRDIAATDAFLGVDLTNTGANIEGYRSPHAPNMVRLVPGKVRKRMGYYKEVLFGTKTNVNFAKDTSAKEQEIVITSDDTATWVKVYDLIKTLSFDSSSSLYLDFDYKSEDTFNIVNSSVEVTASEEWEHISTTVYFTEDTDVEDIKFFSDNVQDIYIKNFSAMLERDDNYEWSPAPKYFVERENNDPIYGCHFLRNGKDGFEGDRTVNTNRAKFSDSAEISTEIEEDSWLMFKELYEVPAPGITAYIDFDYHSNYPIDLAIYADDNTVGSLPAASEYCHYHAEFNEEDNTYGVDNWLRVKKASSSDPTITFTYKNLTVVYEYNADTYKWSPAPEDNGEKFHTEDLYTVSPQNYAIIEEETIDTDNFDYHSPCYETIDICSSTSQTPDVLTRVSFEVSISEKTTTGSSATITIQVRNNNGVIAFYDGFGNYHSNEKYDLFLSARGVNRYIKDIRIILSSTVTQKAHIEIKNIQVNSYSVRDSFYVSPKMYLYHVGGDFYIHRNGDSDFRKVYSSANEKISRSFQLNNKCYIIDGANFYEYSIDGGGYVEVIDQENAYIPWVTLAKEPSGGGTSNEALNLLQPGFIETFQGKANVTEYQLSFSGLDATDVKAWLLNSSGEWIEKKEGTHFSVNRTSGKVTFNTAPGVSPLSGEDNVKIQAYRTVPDYRERITKCTIGALYGIGGATNRIFLAGNPDHPNWDFYCQMDDPTYFPDIAYSVMGSEQSMIKGYAVVSNYLATFKDGFDQSQSVFVREGDMLVTDEETKTSEPVFKLVNTLQGEGVVAPYSFGYLQTEPVFLTKAGIYAITEQDITGEKYSQNRSFYLDGKLRKETGLENAIATVYDNQYILALNGKLYVLDGLQATRTDKSEPYATRQYAGFLCEDIPATCLWTDDAVCFGTSDGKVCKFYTDVDSLSSYNDDGKAIYSCWETPDLDGQLFYKNKTFRYMAVRLMAALKTSVKLYSRRFGIWTLNDETAWTFIKGQTAIGNSLDFNNLDFNLFSFSADTTERVVHTKLRVKKVDKARFRVENGELDEPFGIFDLALEYIESGNYKG